MTNQNAPPEVKSVADAIDQGVVLADAGGTVPAPAADDEGGDDGNDTAIDTGTDGAGTEGAPDGGTPGDKSGDAGDTAGQDGDGADPADGKGAGDGTGGDDDAGADKGAAGTDGKPGSKEGKPGDKKLDHFNDPIPNALKPATKERIRFLATEATTQKQRADTATGERDELIKAVTDTGASPEQYAGVLDYLELVNSNDRNKQIAAANFMIRELAALSRVGGFRIPGITNLSGYPDLEKAVAEGKLTQELAEEVAAGRSATAHQGKVGAAQAQASRARQAYQQADEAARTEMNTMEAGFAKNDPLYTQKKPLIVEMLNEMIRGDKRAGIPPLHPSKWPSAYKKIYETLPKTLGGMKPVARPGAGAGQPNGKIPANQPLRAQQPAGAQKQEPKSVAEALEMGIDMARGG